MKNRFNITKATCRTLQLCTVGLLLSATSLAAPGETLPLSIGLPGYGPMGQAVDSAISANGRFVAFASYAQDLVLGDANTLADIFVAEIQTGMVSRVSLSTTGLAGNFNCSTPSISGDGHMVVFSSRSTNLVAGDVNGAEDIFLHDRLTGTTRIVSLNSSGEPSNGRSYEPTISDNGRFVTFTSSATNLASGDTNGSDDIFVKELATGAISRVSVSSAGAQGSSSSSNADISADGRFVAYQSVSGNLVKGDANSLSDIFVRDRLLATTTRVSVSEAGAEGNGAASNASISAKGESVAFESAATNLVPDDTHPNLDVLVKGVQMGTLTRASAAASGTLANGSSYVPDISANAQFVTFQSSASNLVAADTNGLPDVFVRNLAAGTTVLASPSSPAVSVYNQWMLPSISGDGQRISFVSDSPNLVESDFNSRSDVFVHNLGGATQRIGYSTLAVLGNEASIRSSITSGGRFVAFGSRASNLVPNDTNGSHDIFVRDMLEGTISRVNVSTSGVQANSGCSEPSIASNGRYVVFSSYSSNLVGDDTNTRADVFVRDMLTNTTSRISLSPTGVQGNNDSYSPSISADGRHIVFSSYANNLVDDDINGREDVYLRDTVSGTMTRVSVGLENYGNGNSHSGSVSTDGRFIAFASIASNFVAGDSNGVYDIYVRDRTLGTTSRISTSFDGNEPNQHSFSPCISGDGRYVAFVSSATNLVPEDTNGREDVFVFDRQTSSMRRVSISSNGTQADGHSRVESICANGRVVLFQSRASNLVTPNVNYSNIFIHDMATGATILANVSSTGATSNGPSLYANLSPDGNFAVFESPATNLTDIFAVNGHSNMFRREIGMPLTLSLQFADWQGARPPLRANYVLRASNGTVTAAGNLEVTATGQIFIPRPATGVYDLLVKSRTFLAKRIQVSVSPSGGNLGSLALTNGDVDGNNIIEIGDYSALSLAFGTNPNSGSWNADADLNGDGLVDLADYSILSRNFSFVGDE